jgi:Tfp pilus assembly protein PilF
MKTVCILLLSIVLLACVAAKEQAKVPLDPALRLAQMAEQSGHFSIAEHAYETAYHKHPSDIDTLVQLARLYQRENKIDAAMGVYQQIQKKQAAFPADVHLANLYAQKGEFAHSLLAWQTALKKGAQAAAIDNDIGVLLGFHRYQHDAVACFDAALAHDHRNVLVQNNRLITQMMQGDTAAQQKYLRHIKMKAAHDPAIINNMRVLSQGLVSHGLQVSSSYGGNSIALEYSAAPLGHDVAHQLYQLCLRGV